MVFAVARAVRLVPAEAMRPAPPAFYHRGIIEKTKLLRWFSPSARMALRDVVRQPLRLMGSLLTVAFSAAIV